MVWQILYPGVIFLAMFVMIVIMLILLFGSRWLKLRHVTFSEREKEWEGKAYEQPVSYA